MTKHFSEGVTRKGVRVEIDTGYERGIHAAYLTVTELSTGRVLYDDHLYYPIGSMRPRDVAAVLFNFGLRLPDEMMAALEADYAGGAAPYVKRWPEALAVTTLQA